MHIWGLGIILFMFMIYVIYLLPTYMAYVCDKNATTTRNEIVVNNKQKVRSLKQFYGIAPKTWN